MYDSAQFRLKSDRIFHVDKSVLQPKFFAESLSQGPNTVSLRRMVSSSKVVNPQLAREVHGLLGNFAGYIGIHPICGRFFNVVLGGTRAPANLFDRLVSRTDIERLSV